MIFHVYLECAGIAIELGDYQTEKQISLGDRWKPQFSGFNYYVCGLRTEQYEKGPEHYMYLKRERIVEPPKTQELGCTLKVKQRNKDRGFINLQSHFECPKECAERCSFVKHYIHEIPDMESYEFYDGPIKIKPL